MGCLRSQAQAGEGKKKGKGAQRPQKAAKVAELREELESLKETQARVEAATPPSPPKQRTS